MTHDSTRGDAADDLASPASAICALSGSAIGAGVAILALPALAPALASSLLAPAPKTFWMLSRASGLVAGALLAASVLFGLLLSTRLGRSWPGAATTFVLHEQTSLLALALSAFHALVLLGDQHTTFTALEIALPFGASHRPLGVGLGQVALYGMALLVASFYLRSRIGPRAFRAIHFASFATYALALIHGMAIGTDRALVLVALVPAAATVFFTALRALEHLFGKQEVSSRGAGGRR